MKVQKARKSKRVEIPEPQDDPSERKRVLNVLAQRRYRERKKERVKQLEEQVQAIGVRNSSDAASSEDVTDASETPPRMQALGHEASEKPTYSCTPDFELLLHEEDNSFGTYDPTLLQIDPLSAWNPAAWFPIPSLPSTPSGISSSSTSPVSVPSNAANSGEGAPLDFPDEAHLPVLELNILRGCMTVARRLNVEASIWSLESNSPFNQAVGTMLNYEHLPYNLRPSLAQKHHAHHPVLDILPWPSVRDKLIMVFSQPIEFRPPVAASATGLLELIYDIEDSAEGVRICGDDPCSEHNWEVGQQVFTRWWWAFDSRIVQHSNLLRERRGAAPLGRAVPVSSDSGYVEGEIL